MDIRKFLQDYSQEINGEYSEYDENKSVIIVPLPDERYQAIVGKINHNETYDKETIEFSSKVCSVREDIDYTTLLKANSDFIHAKFIVDEDFLKVEAGTFSEITNEAHLKQIISEVANLADQWELKITGKDIH